MLKNLIEQFIIKEYKFKYLIFSIVSGILLALSFQRFNLYLLAWIAFIPLIYCIYKNNLKKSILYGFITGIIYSLISFNWMFLFLLENTKSLFSSFIVSMIVWLSLSIYFCIWTGFVNCFNKLNKVLVMLFVSSLWVILEYIKNYCFGSFPINLLGYSQELFETMIQVADIFGVYGISFSIILVNTLLFYWLYTKQKKYLIYSLTIVLILIIYGYIRINQMSKMEYGNEITIGVVQPNVKQKYKFKKRYKEIIIDKLFKNIQYFENKNVDILLLPETVLPGYLNEKKELQKFVLDASHFSEHMLIGGMDVENRKVYNSIFIISKDGNIVDKYNKKHLILFGEYIPFNGFLAKMFSKYISNNDLTNEIELKVFKFDKYALGINICSENYYPYLSRDLVLKGATLLTTHSNDAWCDGLFYPYQHFALNVFRAIENRKYLVIASNTGISGVISPTGKIVRQTKNQEQICFEEVVYTNNYITIYDKIGDLFVYLCMCYVGIIVIYTLFVLLKKKN